MIVVVRGTEGSAASRKRFKLGSVVDDCYNNGGLKRASSLVAVSSSGLRNKKECAVRDRSSAIGIDKQKEEGGGDVELGEEE